MCFSRGSHHFNPVVTLVDRTTEDVANPGVAPQIVSVPDASSVRDTVVRYLRITATKLAPRQNDYIFALAELSVLTPDGANVALGKAVTAFDSIEAGGTAASFIALS